MGRRVARGGVWGEGEASGRCAPHSWSCWLMGQRQNFPVGTGHCFPWHLVQLTQISVTWMDWMDGKSLAQRHTCAGRPYPR